MWLFGRTGLASGAQTARKPCGLDLNGIDPATHTPHIGEHGIDDVTAAVHKISTGQPVHDAQQIRELGSGVCSCRCRVWHVMDP